MIAKRAGGTPNSLAIGPRERITFRTERFVSRGIGISAVIGNGEGIPILFIHGNSSSKLVWTHQLALMKQLERPFIAPDLPGHGESDDAIVPDVTYSFPGYAAVLSDLTSQLGWESFDVVGWSLGGHVGLQLLAVDQRVHSLLISGTPPARPCAEALEEAFFPTDDMGLAGKADFSDSDALAYVTAMMGGPAYVTPELLKVARRTDGRARWFLFATALARIGADQREIVQTSEKPLCVVHGENEPFVRLSYLRSLDYRALWPGCVQVIPNAGHAPHWQTPADFNELLTAFLTHAEAVDQTKVSKEPQLPTAQSTSSIYQEGTAILEKPRGAVRGLR